MSEVFWMAPAGVETQKNVIFHARASFFAADSSRLKISAESVFRLWCNGQFVGTGPARGTKTLAFFDEFDLAPHLKAGENRLEISVLCPNVPTFKAAPIRPALWCEWEGETLDWQVAPARDFRRDVPLYTFQMGFMEWRDLRLETQETEWQAPERFALPKNLLPRDIPALRQTIWEPTGALQIAAVPPLLDRQNTAVARQITNEPHSPLGVEAAAELPLRLAPTRGGVALVFDFGRAITGGIEIELDAPAGTICDLGYEEQVENERLRVFQPHEDGRDYAFADRFIAREGHQILGPTLQERGFRFVQVVLRDFARPIALKAVRALDRRFPLPPFQSSETDPFCRRLLEMAHHTLSTCATDVLTDCPWREGAFWVNDFVVNAPFWLAIGGDVSLVERCLRLALSERNRDGLIYGVCPSDGSERLVFLSTNTFLPLIVADLRAAQGHWQSFVEPIAQITRSLRAFEDSDGLLVSPPQFWNFLDWSYPFSGNDIEQRASAAQSLFYVWALDTMADLSGDSNWKARADQVYAGVQKRFWDDRRGLFREFDGEETATQLAQALALLTGRSAGHRETLLATLENGTRQSEGLVRSELYMMHFVMRALKENGRPQAAHQLLREFWGPMVESGSTTLWEAGVHQAGKAAFDRSGSLCHAFSCAPLLIYSQPP